MITLTSAQTRVVNRMKEGCVLRQYQDANPYAVLWDGHDVEGVRLDTLESLYRKGVIKEFNRRFPLVEYCLA